MAHKTLRSSTLQKCDAFRGDFKNMPWMGCACVGWLALANFHWSLKRTTLLVYVGQTWDVEEWQNNSGRSQMSHNNLRAFPCHFSFELYILSILAAMFCLSLRIGDLYCFFSCLWHYLAFEIFSLKFSTCSSPPNNKQLNITIFLIKIGFVKVNQMTVKVKVSSCLASLLCILTKLIELSRTFSWYSVIFVYLWKFITNANVNIFTMHT